MSEHFKKLGGFTINRDTFLTEALLCVRVLCVFNRRCCASEYFKELGGFTINRETFLIETLLYVRALQGTRWIYDQQRRY